jgi:hypothetical protein
MPIDVFDYGKKQSSADDGLSEFVLCFCVGDDWYTQEVVDKKAKQTFFFGGRRLGAGEEHKEAATAIDTEGGLAGTKLIIGCGYVILCGLLVNCRKHTYSRHQ